MCEAPCRLQGRVRKSVERRRIGFILTEAVETLGGAECYRRTSDILGYLAKARITKIDKISETATCGCNGENAKSGASSTVDIEKHISRCERCRKSEGVSEMAET